MRPTKPHRFWLVATLVAATAVGTAACAWYRSTRLPKRFAAVVEAQLYRSAAVTPGQLKRLQRDHGIRRVICLLNAQAPETQAEREAAERLGIEWHSVPLPGNGASTPAERRRILELLGDIENGPTLVHCAAGATRTGLAIGMYRLHRQGWTPEQVLREMRAFDFDDGPQHENLRQALAAEAALAGAAASRPAAVP